MSVDLQLFVEQAAWLAPQLADSSRVGVLTWLGRRLDDDARKRFMRHFPLSHDLQRQAERAVCALLGRALTAEATRIVPVEDVTRHVDWPLTYARSTLGARTPRPMLARVTHHVPDRFCLGALATLARSWCSLLELADGEGEHSTEYRARIVALHRLMGSRIVRSLPPQSFGPRHVARLRRLDAEAAGHVRSIQDALSFWNRSFGSHADDRTALERIGLALNEADVTNIDTLLEATTAISIARAAVEAESADLPQGIPWRLRSLESASGKYPVITLESGELVCEIAKGTPRGGSVGGVRSKVADLLSPWADETLPPRPDGRSRSNGRQPDIVVSFWRARDPSRVVIALADAKRNATGDGESYLRASLEVAATYLMSFGHCMGLQLKAAPSARYATTLMPGVTIFCRQGARDDVGAVARMREDCGPVVMAFDVAKHMSPTSRPWRAPALSAWFGSLARQATKGLPCT